MQPISHPPKIVRFGTFEANFSTGELRKSGLRMKLPGLPFLVLELLLEHPGEVVARENLRSRLWPDGTFVDFENSLNTAVNKLRSALGETAAEARYIETLPRRGYRFIAAVETPAKTLPPRIVVLPFDDLRRDPNDEYFADGLTEELIAQLGRMHAGRLGVIARTSAMHYKNTHKTITEIAHELAVDFLLEGTVRREENAVRVTAQLIRAQDQVHLWAETYDRTLDKVLAVQADVASRIGAHLALELLTEKPQATVNASAYEAYLKGRFYWNKRSEAGLARAIENYQYAIAIDPNYALPYIGLADIYNGIGLYSVVGFAELTLTSESASKARAAAERAVALDPLRSEAHTSLAFAKFLYDWDWAGAESEFKLALEMNPNDATSHGWYALYLSARGRVEESLSEIKTALHLDPLSLVANTYKGWILYFARRYDEALAQLRYTCEMDPGFPLARYILGLVLVQTRTYSDALEQFTKAFESLGHPGILAALKQCYQQALRGEPLKPSDHTLSAYLEAVVYLAMNRKNAALTALELAYQQRSCWLVNLGVEPAMDPLRNEPRFTALLESIDATATPALPRLH